MPLIRAETATQQSAGPTDPRVWFARLLDAIAAYQRGDRGPVVEYLRFVEKYRGREVAETAGRRLHALALHRAFQQSNSDPRELGKVPRK